MAQGGRDFDSLFAAEYAPVLRTVYLICRDAQQAQDATQDAFVELLRHWGKVSQYDRPGAWVRRVAIRKLGKSRRREARRREADIDFEPPTPLEHADLDLLRAVSELPLRQRKAVVLYYYEDRPLHEVAELLDCSTSTAAVHVHRARAKLGGLLQEVTRDGR
jgi:RNA polymerase sigma-70 factor (ECF subfamily)